MAISFCGVVMTAFSVTKGEDDEEGEEKKERAIFQDNDSLAAFVGCAMIIIAAILNGALAVQSRILQHIDVFVTLFYVLSFSILTSGIWIVVEFFVCGHDQFRLFTMNSEQFFACFIAASVNFTQLIGKIIAY